MRRNHLIFQNNRKGGACALKTRWWILIFSVIFLFCSLLGWFLLRPAGAAVQAEIYSDGIFFCRISLLQDQVLSIPASGGGFNEITVKDGKIAVTSASCPDHYCLHRGFCNSGAPIICLPNALEIRFVSSSGPDISTN